jgi:hypothetical protein
VRRGREACYIDMAIFYEAKVASTYTYTKKFYLFVKDGQI